MTDINTFKAGDELTSSRLNEMVNQINTNADTKALADANSEAILANAVADAETAANVQKNADAIAKLDAALAAIQTVVNANAALSNEVTALSKVVNTRKATTQVIAITDEAAAVGEESKDIIVTSTDPVNVNTAVAGKNISVQDLSTKSATLKLTGTGVVDIAGLTTSGAIDKKTQGNTSVSVNTTGDTIRISGCDFTAAGYNTVELQLANSSTAATSIVIEDCKFGDTSNNSISIFKTGADANITIKNCTFGKVSNVLRLSNATDQKCTVTMIDCDIEAVDNSEWHGIVICQDYTSSSAEACAANNLFAPEKLTVNFINTTVAGEKVVAGEPEKQFGSKSTDQILFVYTDKEGMVTYSADRYPTVTFG